MRVVESPATTSLTHAGAGSLKYSLVLDDVGIFVVGFTVGLIAVAFVGFRDNGFTVGLAVGCRDDGFIDGLAVGFLDVGATVGRLDGIFLGCRDEGFIVVGFLDVGRMLGLLVVGGTVGFAVGDFVVGALLELDAIISIGTSLLLNNLPAIDCPSTVPDTSMYPPTLLSCNRFLWGSPLARTEDVMQITNAAYDECLIFHVYPTWVNDLNMIHDT